MESRTTGRRAENPAAAGASSRRAREGSRDLETLGVCPVALGRVGDDTGTDWIVVNVRDQSRGPRRRRRQSRSASRQTRGRIQRAGDSTTGRMPCSAGEGSPRGLPRLLAVPNGRELIRQKAAATMFVWSWARASFRYGPFRVTAQAPRAIHEARDDVMGNPRCVRSCSSRHAALSGGEVPGFRVRRISSIVPI